MKTRRRTAFVLALAMALALVLTGCGSSKYDADVDLGAVMDEIAAQYELPEMLVLSDASDLTTHYGIDPADVEDFAAEICSTGINADEIVLIHAVDAEAADRIAEKLETRYDAKLQQADGYLPDQYAIIQEGKVETDGNYVSMIISPDSEGMRELYHDSF